MHRSYQEKGTAAELARKEDQGQDPKDEGGHRAMRQPLCVTPGPCQGGRTIAELGEAALGANGGLVPR